MLVFYKRVHGLNRKREILLRRYLETGAIKVQNEKRRCRWIFLTVPPLKLFPALVLHQGLASPNTAYLRRFRASSQEIEANLVFQNVKFAHIFRTDVIFFFKRSREAQYTLHRVWKLCFTKRNCCRAVCDISQFDCLSWRNGLVINTKRVADVHAQWYLISLHLVRVP